MITAYSSTNYLTDISIVMGSIENFLSRLLKDKTPQYHGSYIAIEEFLHINYFTENFTLHVTMQLLSNCKIFSE